MNTKNKKVEESNNKTQEKVIKKVFKKKNKQKKNISTGIAFVNSSPQGVQSLRGPVGDLTSSLVIKLPG